MPQLSALILAGGRGTRLGGANKALLEIGGRTNVARQLSVLHRLTSEIIAVANDQGLAAYGVRIVPDAEPGAGPLMGLASGLRAASGELCVVVACDLPFLNAALIERLVELAEGWDLVAPIVAGQPEPTHAVYRRATCLPAIDRALARGERRMISFWPEVQVRAVPEEELRALDPDLRSFFNVNTPADLELAERWAAGGDRPAGADERGA